MIHLSLGAKKGIRYGTIATLLLRKYAVVFIYLICLFLCLYSSLFASEYAQPTAPDIGVFLRTKYSKYTYYLETWLRGD